MQHTQASLCSKGSLANFWTRAACESFMGRLTWNIVWKYHQPKFLTHLPKYLIGEPFHLSGILGVASSSARVSIELGGLWGDHSSSHRRLNIVSLVSLSTTEPCSHVKEWALALKESHPGQDCLIFWSLLWATSEPGTLVGPRCPGDTAGGSCETSDSSHSCEERLRLNLLTKYRKCTPAGGSASSQLWVRRKVDHQWSQDEPPQRSLHCQALQHLHWDYESAEVMIELFLSFKILIFLVWKISKAKFMIGPSTGGAPSRT